MRCNQCRQELGLAHHYWGMPFCSTVCMEGYKSRLGEGTRAKIASLVVAKTAEGRSRHWRHMPQGTPYPGGAYRGWRQQGKSPDDGATMPRSPWPARAPVI